jgi:hypothetical protein
MLFLVSLLGIADWGQSTRSWLLNNDLGRLVGSALWMVALIGFCAAAYGLGSQQAWWRNVAIIASVISIAGVILFWAAPASSPAVAALIFNVMVLAALLIVHWPSIEAVGA